MNGGGGDLVPGSNPGRPTSIVHHRTEDMFMSPSVANGLVALLAIALIVAFWQPLGLFLISLGLGGASIGIAAAVLGIGAVLTVAFVRARL
jgi:hypothetical protein